MKRTLTERERRELFDKHPELNINMPIFIDTDCPRDWAYIYNNEIIIGVDWLKCWDEFDIALEP